MKFRRQQALLVLILTADIFLGGGLIRMAAESGERAAVSAVFAGKEAEDRRGGPEQESAGTVALTFDDGPNERYTEALLDGLEKRGVKASFFLLGDCIRGNEATVKRMDAEGHLIGVHGMSHVDLTGEDVETALGQLRQAREMIAQITGKRPEYMRPPYGNWNGALAERTEMEPVFWSVDTLDWKLRDAEAITERTLHCVEDGSVILMHDGFETSVEAAFAIIDNLLADGYTFVTADELMID